MTQTDNLVLIKYNTTRNKLGNYYKLDVMSENLLQARGFLSKMLRLLNSIPIERESYGLLH